jgi:hypothetical protein
MRTLKPILSRILLPLAAVPLMAPTCGTQTTVVANDTSPPAAALHLGVDGAGQVDPFPGSGVVTVGIEDTFCVYGSVEDPQGAKSLTIGAESLLTCSSGGFGQLIRATFVPLSDSQTGSTGSTVFTGLFNSRCHVPMDDVRACPNGWRVDALSYRYDVVGRNFSNRSSVKSGEVRVDIAPPPPPPPPPIGCPAGEICCAEDEAGNCEMCIDPPQESCP